MSNVDGPEPPRSALAAFLAVEQGALDAVPAGIYVCAPDGGLLRYNRRAVGIWGRAPAFGVRAELDMFRRSGADGRPLLLSVPPMGPVLRSGESISGAEFLVARPDGSHVPVLMNIAPLHDRGGAVEGAVCSFQELTRRKQAVEALRASEAELQAVIHQTPFMLVRCSREKRYRFVSQEYARWLGKPRERVVGASIEEIIGLENFAIVRPHVEKVLQGSPVDFECEMYFAKVGRRNLHVSYRPELGAGGGVDGWIASMLDITERKRSEDQLRKLSDRLSEEVERRTLERDRIWSLSEDLLGVRDFEGYLLSINPAWTRLLGWSEAEIKLLNINELRHPDDADQTLEAVRQLVQGASATRVENRLRHKDGSWRWLQWTMTENDGVIYLSGRHVTAEKEAAVELEQAQLRAAHLQKMEALGQLTGGIAHDFNNLLMIVSGHAQRLNNRLADAADMRALEAIRMAASRGENLTRQLLSFSRTLPLDPTPLSLAEAIVGLRDVLSGSLHVNIELLVDIPETTWTVCVDKSELELALVNLAVNARDAMPERGRLSITARNFKLNAGDTPEGLTGEAVALTVGDTGSGIPEALLQRVIEPFFTTKGPDKGTGLGLSQVYGFARRSGGTMVIESTPGEGTQVTIYLPRNHAAASAVSPQVTAPYRAAAAETVLVVEDNADVREVAVSLLQQLGYRTLAVRDAAAALAALGSGTRIDLVFTDVVLPGRSDGVALAEAITARAPHIPVVLTTGYSKGFDEKPGYPLLRKPYQLPALGRIIHETLQLSRAQRPPAP